MCARFNRAIQCHESTWIVISINILQTIVNEISRNTTLAPSSLINILRELQVANEEKKDCFSKFIDCIEYIKVDVSFYILLFRNAFAFIRLYLCFKGLILKFTSHLFRK